MNSQNVFHDDEKISRLWRYGAFLVAAVGFTVLIYITSLAYENIAPIPAKVVAPNGNTLFTREEIQAGQTVFFKYNLMEHGTLWGHGAYLGPDYSAKHLHELALFLQSDLSPQLLHKEYSQTNEEEKLRIRDAITTLLKKNKFDKDQDSLLYTDEEVKGYQALKKFWINYFTDGSAPGLPKNYISDPRELENLASFFSWAGWVASTKRPGTDDTYTNNFPYDPDIGNLPGADAYFWSAISLIFLLGAIGMILFFFGKFNFLGWDSSGEVKHLHETHVHDYKLTPSQISTIPYFVVVALLFLLQSFAGGGVAHYRVDSEFYGLSIIDWFPYNLLRTWHLQLAIFWIATAWVGCGLFLAPMFTGREPRFQSLLVKGLLAAIAFVALGSLAGELVSFHQLLPGELWFWIGNQGSEYLDLGRAWQYLLIGGLFIWIFLIFRCIWPAFFNKDTKEMAILFCLAASAIPIFYIPALFYDHQTHYTIIDNWRFWIIHLWVEGFFEVFATVITAIIFVLMGVTKLATAKRVIYLDIILYLGSGVIGTGHHWYFTGQTNFNMALSACFSAMEVVPLTLLTLDAWDFISMSNKKCQQCGLYLAARQKWTIMFLIAVGVWNFVGAGIFGFLINLPVISYFEIGTNLTPNHGHAAMFGVFGMLSLGLTLFCLRTYQTEEIWKKTEPFIKVGFYGLNIGMGLMVLIDLFPSGILQMWDSMKHGYWHARELSFIMEGLFHRLEWARLFADMIFICLGVIPFVYAVLYTFFKARKMKRLATF